MRLIVALGLAACGRLNFEPLESLAGDASGDGAKACTTFGPWGPANQLDTINTDDNDLAPALHPNGLTLIFDDYHELGDDAVFHRAVCAALEQMPEGRQIVIISRNVAPPAFAHRWAGRRVALIDWDALKLTREETRRLVALQRKRSSGTAPENLHDQCEGWVTGFILLLEQSRAAPAVAVEEPCDGND